MDNIKKRMKNIIIIIVIICLICIVALYLINKSGSETNTNEVITEGEGDEQVEIVLEKVKEPTRFFSVEQCIKDNKDESFVAKDMNILAKDIVYSYSVYGINNKQEEVYYIVRVDTENMTFSIEEVEDSYNNINDIKLENDIENIADNGTNTFEYTTMSDEDICRFYLQHFLQLENENPEEAYSILNKEYKEERFPTFEDFQEYLKECQTIISDGVLAKYSVNYYDDYIEYVLVDTYDNSYTVDAKSVMDYDIKLDNYTIKARDYEKKYLKLSDNKKVQSNVYIFLQMINTKDYKHAYNLLDETFRNNNFGTVENFKQYVQNNFFTYNLNSDDVNIEKEGKYYIYKTSISSDSSSAAETKQLTIIMELKEGIDFVMSFSI